MRLTENRNSGTVIIDQAVAKNLFGAQFITGQLNERSCPMSVEPKKSRPPRKLAMLAITIPESLSDQAASFLGEGIISDPAFWMIALRTGVEEMERQYREIEADAHKRAAEDGSIVIFGSPTIIDQDDDDGLFDADDLPF